MIKRGLASLVLAVALAGCAGPARRPEEAAVVTPDFSSRISAYVADTIPGSQTGITHTAGAAGSPAGAGSASGAATRRVGVATVVVGNVAVVGIDPQTWPALGSAQVRQLQMRTHDQFPQLTEVRISVDGAQVNRIARLQRDMQVGVPASVLLDEIEAVLAQTKPQG